MRNRELAEVAFPNEPTPKYGPSMLLSMYCGKWMVCQKLSDSCILIYAKTGAGDITSRVAEGRSEQEQSPDIHKVGEAIGNVRISPQ